MRKLVEHLSDEELQTLPRGGHDYRKLYAAYKAASEHIGAPTAILAKTIKGWTLGPEIESRNATHQIKKMTKDQLRVLRDRLHLHEEIPDDALDADAPPYYRPPVGSPVHEYLTARGRALGGHLPHRVVRGRGLLGLPAPEPATFAEFALGSRGQPVSTTMAFARLLRNLLRDPGVGKYVVPIVPDEGRTFGLDALVLGGEDLRPGGSALHARRCRPASVVLGGPHRPDPGGGHHGGRRHGKLPGGRDVVRDVVPADAADLPRSTRCSVSSGWET